MNVAAAKGQTEPMSRFLPTILLFAMLLVPALPAHAETRAWLDRERIQSGETATLNVETDQRGVDTPDWSPLDADFEVSGHTSTRRVEVVNGQTRVRSLFAVALQPRDEGALTVPALQVGSESTAPLTLTVLPAQDVPAQAGAVAFIETELDTGRAWVQQAVGYVLRLHYATPLVSGELEQPQPEGATLQRIGDDLQYSREIGGRRYSVVERRFLLVPERSGTLDIPAARFRGRGSGGFFDDMFGSGPRNLRASSEPQRLQVQPPAAPLFECKRFRMREAVANTRFFPRFVGDGHRFRCLEQTLVTGHPQLGIEDHPPRHTTHHARWPIMRAPCWRARCPSYKTSA